MNFKDKTASQYDVAAAPEETASERAKESGLITFPHELPGTKCSNCIFYGKTKDKLDFCTHPKLQVMLPDGAENMCCNRWGEARRDQYTDMELSLK